MPTKCKTYGSKEDKEKEITGMLTLSVNIPVGGFVQCRIYERVIRAKGKNAISLQKRNRKK